MTIFQSIADAHKRFENSLSRAEFYKEKKRDDEALREYMEALREYCLSISLLDSALKQNLSELRNFNSSNEVKVLFNLYRILSGINTVAGSLGKNIIDMAVYSAHAICLITNKLGEKSHEFDANILDLYEGMLEIYEIKSADVQQFKSVLDRIQAVEPDKTESLDLQKIRVALQSISSCEHACPVLVDLFEKRKLNSSGCFIATAAYMTTEHPDLDTFRNFRDQKLLSNAFGKLFVSIYYRVSPSIASYLQQKPRLRQIVKRQLMILANWLREQVES